MNLLVENETRQGSLAALPTTVESPATPASNPGRPPGLFSRQRGSRLSRRELLNLTSQLAVMIRSGVDLASALKSLLRHSRRPMLKSTLAEIYDDVLGGKAFSTALAKHETVFGSTYVASIAAAEASGDLAVVLAQLASSLRGEVRLRAAIRTMMTYPIVLTSVSFLVVSSLVIFVLPRFAEIFQQFEMPLPALTRVLLWIGAEFRERLWLYAPLAVVGVLGGIVLLRSEAGRRKRDRWILSARFVRNVSRPLLIGRACRLLGMLTESGVPLLESLRLARSAVGNMCYHDLFQQLEDDVLNGQGLGESLVHCPFVPDAAAEMITTAELTGTFGEVTRLLGEHFEEEGETRMRELVALLEPAITLVMGVVVAFIVLSVLLPMLDLSTLGQ